MHNDSHEPIDLSALDPVRDRASLDIRIAQIASHAMDARQRSDAAELEGIVMALMAWARPTVLAAGILLAIALTAVVRTSASPSTTSNISAADAMGLPRPLIDILHSTAPPSLAQIDLALAAAAAVRSAR